MYKIFYKCQMCGQMFETVENYDIAPQLSMIQYFNHPHQCDPSKGLEGIVTTVGYQKIESEER